MTHPLHEAFAFNAKGVELVTSRNFKEGIRAFHQALTIANNGSADESCFLDNSTSAPWIYETVQARDVSFGDREGFAIFDLFFIAYPPAFTQIVSKEEYDVLTATLVYNFALALHLAPLGENRNRRRQACHLYKLTAEHLRCAEAVMHHAQHLSLIVANNLAALALETYELEDFARYREATTGLLLTVASDETNFYTGFFAINVTASACVKSRPAPAA